MLYKFLLKFLFLLEPESAHKLALKLLKLKYCLFKKRSFRDFRQNTSSVIVLSQSHPSPRPQEEKGLVCTRNDETMSKDQNTTSSFKDRQFALKSDKPVKIMGLSFPNPVGLAAGFDKNGQYIAELASLGFGFIEIGTITPKAQAGNLPPRLFRYPKEKALINRMGFNNLGLEAITKILEKSEHTCILGINIGMNKDTALKHAYKDYLSCFNRLANFADYITINISSPNTSGLRKLQEEKYLTKILYKLKAAQNNFYTRNKKYVPLVVKVSPDLTTEQIAKMARLFLDFQIDGIIATNTSINIKINAINGPHGGISGKPLFKQSTKIIQEFYSLLENKIPIIGCGGIFSSDDAYEKILAGAQLVQIYTGLIYKGPALIKSIVLHPL